MTKSRSDENDGSTRRSPPRGALLYQVAQDAEGDGGAVPRGSAAAELVERHQRVFGGGGEHAGRLRQLHQEGAATR
eukprot:280420-Pyramimonas_sp.AAC.1